MVINREPQVFIFLSQILGRSIIGEAGETLGRVYDLTAEFVEPYPVVTGIVQLKHRLQFRPGTSFTLS